MFLSVSQCTHGFRGTTCRSWFSLSTMSSRYETHGVRIGNKHSHQLGHLATTYANVFRFLWKSLKILLFLFLLYIPGHTYPTFPHSSLPRRWQGIVHEPRRATFIHPLYRLIEELSLLHPKRHEVQTCMK